MPSLRDRIAAFLISFGTRCIQAGYTVSPALGDRIIAESERQIRRAALFGQHAP